MRIGTRSVRAGSVAGSASRVITTGCGFGFGFAGGAACVGGGTLSAALLLPPLWSPRKSPTPRAASTTQTTATRRRLICRCRCLRRASRTSCVSTGSAGDRRERAGLVDLSLQLTPEHLGEPLGDADQGVQVHARLDP